MDIFLADTKLNISRGVPAAGLRVRRLVPAQGPPRARPLRPARTTSAAGARAHPRVEREHLRRAYDLVVGFGQATDRPARPRLQGRNRRPAREPDGRARGAPPRPRLRAADPRLAGRAVPVRRSEPAYIDERIPHLSKLMAPTAESVVERARSASSDQRRRGPRSASERRRPGRRRARPRQAG